MKGCPLGIRAFVVVRLTLQMLGRLNSRCQRIASHCNRIRNLQVDHDQELTVNGPWRICFEFRKGDAFNVEIVNYHRG